MSVQGNATSLSAYLTDMSKTMSNFRLNKRPEIPQAYTRNPSKKYATAKNGENCNPSAFATTSRMDKKIKKNKTNKAPLLSIVNTYHD